jgi:hypothetical protein
MDRQRRRHRDQAPPLDLNMADQVLSGALAPEDLPPALGPMAQAIDSMRAAASPTDSKRAEHDRRTIDSMVAFLGAASRHPAGRLRLPTPSALPRRLAGFRIRMATAVVAAALAFLVGVAYAGRLPGPTQNAVSVVLSKVGLSVPRHDKKADGTHEADDQDGTGTQAPVGPDPNGPAHDGLCNAYFHGQGGTEGGKYDSEAFQSLRDGATEAGQTVEEFCGVPASPPGKADEHGKGKDHHGDESGDSQGSGDQGSDEQGSSDQGSGPQENGDQGQGGGHDGSGDQGDQGDGGGNADGESSDG